MIELAIAPNGNRGWMRNGGFHRADGPAIISYSSQLQFWVWHGRWISEYEHMMLVAPEQAND